MADLGSIGESADLTPRLLELSFLSYGVGEMETRTQVRVLDDLIEGTAGFGEMPEASLFLHAIRAAEQPITGIIIDEPPLRFQSFVEDLATLTAHVEIAGSTNPADLVACLVVVRDYRTKDVAATTHPDTSGAWSVQVEPGRWYDATVFSASCPPVTRGPFFAAP